MPRDKQGTAWELDRLIPLTCRFAWPFVVRDESGLVKCGTDQRKSADREENKN